MDVELELVEAVDNFKTRPAVEREAIRYGLALRQIEVLERIAAALEKLGQPITLSPTPDAPRTGKAPYGPV